MMFPLDLFLGKSMVVMSGLLWAVSTHFMKYESSVSLNIDQQRSLSSSGRLSFLANVLGTLRKLVANWKFVFYFLVNQSGSLLYTISLSYNPISVAVPIANSVNLGVIVLLGCLYEENVRIDLRTLAGVLFVGLGLTMCMLS